MDFKKPVPADGDSTIRFFFENLYEYLGDGLTEEEALYVASVLGNYAITSSSSTESLPVLGGLRELLEQFVLSRQTLDSELLEIAGAQSLLFNGFFRDQVRRRHDVRFYDELGRNFFAGASRTCSSRERAALLHRIAKHFPSWTIICRDLSRTFRENQNERFVLRLD